MEEKAEGQRIGRREEGGTRRRKEGRRLALEQKVRKERDSKY